MASNRSNRAGQADDHPLGDGYSGPDRLANVVVELYEAVRAYRFVADPFHPQFAAGEPAHQFEARLARAAIRLDRAFRGLEGIDHESLARGLGLPLSRAISKLKDCFDEQVQRWGWSYLLVHDGEDSIQERLERHRDEKEIPYLRATLAWRTQHEVEDHRAADEKAEEAMRRGLTPMDLAGDDAERKANELRHRWKYDSAFGPDLPTVSEDELGCALKAEKELRYQLDRFSSAFPRCPICDGACDPDNPNGICWSCQSMSGTFGDLLLKYRFRDAEGQNIREQLEQIPEWPTIQNLCCKLFGRRPFDDAMMEELVVWLCENHGKDRNNRGTPEDLLARHEGRPPRSLSYTPLTEVIELLGRALVVQNDPDKDLELVATKLRPTNKRRGAGGRPLDSDPRQDRKIAEAWSTGKHENREMLARAFGMDKQEVVRALDRHRSRARKRNNPET